MSLQGRTISGFIQPCARFESECVVYFLSLRDRSKFDRNEWSKILNQTPLSINYDDWLEITFHLNGDNFSNLKYWQEMSFLKWLRLLDVYNRISKKIEDKNNEK